MKNKLKNGFKETPERFRYAVRAAVKDAESAAPVKSRLSRGARIAVAAALIVALLPTAVFGASKLIGLIAKPVGTYGVAISIESQNPDEYPEYVKMHVEVPEGFIVEPNTDDLKYTQINSDGSYAEGTFSLCPMRPTEQEKSEVVRDVDSYEETSLCGHTAYKVTQLNRTGAFDRVYINYEDVNILLLIYYDNISDDQLRDFVSGISFTEGTADDHTELYYPFDERIENKVEYVYGFVNIPLERDTVMTFRGFSEKNNDESIRYTAQITDVQITDNVNGLENARTERGTNADIITGRNQLYDVEELVDESGKLLPRTVTVTKGGDGFETTDEVLSSTEMDQSLVLITLTYTNLSDEDTIVYIPYGLAVLDENDGVYTPSTVIDPDQNIFATDYCDPEMLYNSDPVDLMKSYYCTPLKANETKEVTIAYRCCTEMLDKAYINIVDVTSAGIVDPYDEAYDSMEDSYPNYIMKVQ